MPHTASTYGYPSVTQILGDRPKPWLEKWRAKWGKRAEQKTAAANRIGTEFHAAVESWLNGYPWAIRYARVVKMFDAFLKWAQSVDDEIHHTELKVVSHKYGYEGTLDAVGTPMYDWKTSNGISDDAELQVAAYAQAYKETHGANIKRAVIVCVSKKKPHHKLIVKEYTLTRRTLNKFLKRLEDFHKFNVKRKPDDGVRQSV